MDYIATFFTHSGAVKYKKHLSKIGVTAELLPVPRRLSSDCGIGARFSTDLNINDFISEDIDKLFLTESTGEKLLYNSGDY